MSADRLTTPSCTAGSAWGQLPGELQFLRVLAAPNHERSHVLRPAAGQPQRSAATPSCYSRDVSSSPSVTSSVLLAAFMVVSSPPRLVRLHECPVPSLHNAAISSPDPYQSVCMFGCEADGFVCRLTTTDSTPFIPRFFKGGRLDVRVICGNVVTGIFVMYPRSLAMLCDLLPSVAGGHTDMIKYTGATAITVRAVVPREGQQITDDVCRDVVISSG